MSPRPYDFRPLSHADLPLIGRWLEMPHVREWWGEPEEELDYMRDMIDGRDSTRPFIVVLAGRPFAYIQYWYIGHHQNADWTGDYPWLAELPPDAVGVDLSIGEPDMVSRGHGSAALRQFTTRLLAEGHRTIIIDPDPRNARAVRAYEKAGYRAVPRLRGRTSDVLIMQFGTTENTADP